MVAAIRIVKLYAHFHRLWITVEELLPRRLTTINCVEPRVSARGDDHIDAGPPDVHRIADEGIAIQILNVARHPGPITTILR